MKRKDGGTGNDTRRGPTRQALQLSAQYQRFLDATVDDHDVNHPDQAQQMLAEFIVKENATPGPKVVSLEELAWRVAGDVRHRHENTNGRQVMEVISQPSLLVHSNLYIKTGENMSMKFGRMNGAAVALAINALASDHAEDAHRFSLKMFALNKLAKLLPDDLSVTLDEVVPKPEEVPEGDL